MTAGQAKPGILPETWFLTRRSGLTASRLSLTRSTRHGVENRALRRCWTRNLRRLPRIPRPRGPRWKDPSILGVDYWKYYNCYTGTGFNNAGANTSTYYPTMRDSLLNSGRPIFFSMCQWGRDNVWTWGGSVGNSWRMSDDIQNNWGSVASIAATAATISQYAAPVGFNDLDMMQIGNGKLSENEERAHFGLCAIAKSPIIMGTDMTKLATSTLEIIKNKGIFSIHQDPLGKVATTFQPSGAAAPSGSSLYPYWAGPLSDGIFIGLIAVDKAGTYSVNFSDVPGLGNGTFSWTEFYSGKTANGTSASFALGLHDMAVIKVNQSAV